jgi:hypothetical protein
MGALDVIDVALTHAFAVAQLLLAYASWRHTRRDPPPLTIMAHGVAVIVHDASPDTVARVAALLQGPGMESLQHASSEPKADR